MSDRKNFFYYILPSIVSALIGIFLIPITTFFLDPKDFGIFAILNAFVMPVTALSSTGATWVLGANFFKVHGDEHKSFIFNLLFFDFLLKFLWIGVLWFVAPILLPHLVNGYETIYQSFFRFSLITIFLSAFTASISYSLVLNRNAKMHTLIEITGPVSSAIITIVCLYFLRLTTISLFIGPLGGEILSAVLGIWIVRNNVKFHLQKKWFKEIFVVGMPSIPMELVNLLANLSDKFFVQRFLNLPSLGIYSHSVNYKSIFGLGFKAFNRVFVPQALEKFSNGGNTEVIRKKIYKWLGLAALGGAFIALFSGEIVNVLSHGKFMAAAPLVPLWYLIIFSYGFGTTYQQFLSVKRKNVYMTISGIVTGLFSILLVAFGVWKFGILGAVIGALLANLITQFSFMIYARKLGCSSIGEKAIFCTAAFVFIVYLLNFSFELNLFARVGIFSVLTIAICYIFDLTAVLFSLLKKQDTITK